MNKFKSLGILLMLLCVTIFCFTACDDDDKDMTPPAITAEGITANPINCQVYHPGDVMPVRYRFTDDTELGNFNIEIHNDFDHHTHSTESEHEHECDDDDDDETHDTSGTPWVYNQDYQIPSGLQNYVASVDIPIPEDIAKGDYHFMIRLTDRAGWQQLKAISIKIE